MTESSQIVTRAQRFAQRAYACVAKRHGAGQDEYARFAKRFPALIHSCGLAQALAFAQAKAPKGFLEDFATALSQGSRDDVLKASRENNVTSYMRLSRESLIAAGWLKRYAEALLEDEKVKKGGRNASVS